ncbi:MAG: hypothetical protein IIX73_00935 [Clostridia bacterium]|nr:hypothetical protein [Clostridia bacterium]MEE1278689.1 DUF5412 family protein [Acutalibacteraceae bacterium]
MRSKKLMTVLFFLAMFTMAFNMFGAIYDSVFYNIDDVPSGQLVAEYNSPNGKQKILCYEVKTVLGNGVRCSLSDGETERNIYWNTKTNEKTIYWADNNIAVINGMRIDVETVVYDSRGGIYDETL